LHAGGLLLSFGSAGEIMTQLRWPVAQVLLPTMAVVLLAACSADVAQEDTADLEMAAAATPLSVYPRATAVSEAGEPAFVRIGPTRRPKGPVKIDIAVSNPEEVMVIPARVTFSPNDWMTPKLLTVTALDDANFDGDQPVQLSFRVAGPGHAPSTYAPPPVEVLSVDDDYTVIAYVSRDVTVGSAPATALSGLNSRGQVIGTFYDAQGIMQSFLWQDGAATEIGAVDGSGASGRALDINDAGAVLVVSSTGARFIFDQGELQTTEGQVFALNDRGHTVGDALYADGERTEVPALGNGPSEARGLNESDHATGFGQPLPFGWHPFLWAGQELTDLGTFGGPAGQGFDINEHDQIVGWMYDQSIRERPFLYDRGQVVDLGSVTGAPFGVANSINNRGDIVGSDGLRGAPDEAWVGRPDQLTALRSLLADGHCFQIIDPVEINDSGYIAARAWDCGVSGSHAVLFEPIKVAR
jgi:probable HAF family extracellular repeat protein